MILSVSRRTDIPNHYSQWFLNRIREGFLYVRNPMNIHQISRIDLSPEVVDCIVFWTKNPGNMLGHLDELRDYMYYFQFTLTGYGKDIEPNLPDKRSELIQTFQRLSESIGKERVILRYDPIFMNDRYTEEYHFRAFAEILCSLKNHTERVVISFLDLYEKTKRNMADTRIQPISLEQQKKMAGSMAKIAQGYGIRIESCGERINLKGLGIRPGSCIDKELLERLTGDRLKLGKDKNQRAACGCVESVEAGAYDTCPNGCKYCYANLNGSQVRDSISLYDVNAPLLCGKVGDKDTITVRRMKSRKEQQICFFD